MPALAVTSACGGLWLRASRGLLLENAAATTAVNRSRRPRVARAVALTSPIGRRRAVTDGGGRETTSVRTGALAAKVAGGDQAHQPEHQTDADEDAECQKTERYRPRP